MGADCGLYLLAVIVRDAIPIRRVNGRFASKARDAYQIARVSKIARRQARQNF